MGLIEPGAGNVIIIHGFAHLRAALDAAGQLRRPLVVATAPGAAAYGGAVWFSALLRQGRAFHPGVELTGVFDCGEAPGHVLAALRSGLTWVRFTGSVRLAQRLTRLAALQGAHIVNDLGPSLDLRAFSDPVPACRAWLTANPDHRIGEPQPI